MEGMQLMREYALCERCAAQKSIPVDVPRVPERACFLCQGLFSRLPQPPRVPSPFRTFALSVTLSPSLEAREETLYTLFGVKGARAIKSDILHEMKARISTMYTAQYEHQEPDIRFCYHAGKNELTYHYESLFLYGKYRKLSRSLAQSRWVCGECNGRGCTHCGGKGILHESVEGILGKKVVEVCESREPILHGCGREDIDVRTLGEGRPFVLEIPFAKRRNIPCDELSRIVNESTTEISVTFLWRVRREAKRIIHAVVPQKTYRAIIAVPHRPTKDECERVKALAGVSLTQRTPHRVLHRRADKIREKRITSIDIRAVTDTTMELTITTQAGTYVKEFINGDGGRTTPSVSEIIPGAYCQELDVIAIDSAFVDWIMKKHALT